jgi:hypothetical protein
MRVLLDGDADILTPEFRAHAEYLIFSSAREFANDVDIATLDIRSSEEVPRERRIMCELKNHLQDGAVIHARCSAERPSAAVEQVAQRVRSALSGRSSRTSSSLPGRRRRSAGP